MRRLLIALTAAALLGGCAGVWDHCDHPATDAPPLGSPAPANR